jgi:hypothetical protein
VVVVIFDVDATPGEHDMGWLLIALGGSFVLASLSNPRSLWQAFSAWQYRNPAANEPSDAKYALSRASCAACGLFLIGLGLNANIELTGDIFGVRDHRATAEQVAAAVQSKSPLTLTHYRDEEKAFASAVESALRDTHPQPDLRVTNTAKVDGARHYTLAGGRDEMFCLTLAETSRSEWKISVGGRPATIGTKVEIRAGLTDGACSAGAG